MLFLKLKAGYLKDNKICSQTGSGLEHPYDFSDLIEKMKIEKKSLEERLIKSEQENYKTALTMCKGSYVYQLF
ncbi:hypothetical protein DBR11_07565 [Pedobacter sp. HMWF019]|nr:hypothetical protein DBR11_07565 [Pedobacter sp. HMWF019]